MKRMHKIFYSLNCIYKEKSIRYNKYLQTLIKLGGLNIHVCCTSSRVYWKLCENGERTSLRYKQTLASSELPRRMCVLVRYITVNEALYLPINTELYTVSLGLDYGCCCYWWCCWCYYCCCCYRCSKCSEKLAEALIVLRKLVIA